MLTWNVQACLTCGKWILWLGTELGCKGPTFYTYHAISLFFEKMVGYSMHLEVCPLLFTALLCLLQPLRCFLQQLSSNCWLLYLYHSLCHGNVTAPSSMNSGSICTFSESWASQIPTAILSHINSSCNSLHWEYMARAYMSVINLSTDSVSLCCCPLNFVHSCIMF